MTLNPDIVRARASEIEESVARLERMARFRNLLVHMYWKIDYQRVHEIIRHDLQDLRAFVTVVVRLAQEPPGDHPLPSPAG